MPTEYRTAPTISLEEAETQERFHLEQADFHKKKAASWAIIKQAILDVNAPEPGYRHEPPPTPVAAVAPNISKKGMVLTILLTMGPLATAEIVGNLISAGFSGTTQSNTSPQLSLYKASGLIDLANGMWSITTKGRDWLQDMKN